MKYPLRVLFTSLSIYVSILMGILFAFGTMAQEASAYSYSQSGYSYGQGSYSGSIDQGTSGYSQGSYYSQSGYSYGQGSYSSGGSYSSPYSQSGYSGSSNSSDTGSSPSWSDVQNFSNSYRQGTYNSLTGQDSGSSGGSGSYSSVGSSDSSSGSIKPSSTWDWVVTAATSVTENVVEYGTKVLQVAQKALGITPAPTYTELPDSSKDAPVVQETASTYSGTAQTQTVPRHSEPIPDFIYEQFAQQEAIERAQTQTGPALSAAEQERVDRACLSGLDCKSPPVRAAVLQVEARTAQEAVDRLLAVEERYGIDLNSVIKGDVALLGKTDSQATRELAELGVTRTELLEKMQEVDVREKEVAKTSSDVTSVPDLSFREEDPERVDVATLDMEDRFGIGEVEQQRVYESDRRLMELSYEKEVQEVISHTQELLSGRPLRDQEEAFIRAHIAKGSVEETMQALDAALPKGSPNNGTVLFQATMGTDNSSARLFGVTQEDVELTKRIEERLSKGADIQQAQVQTLRNTVIEEHSRPEVASELSIQEPREPLPAPQKVAGNIVGDLWNKTTEALCFWCEKTPPAEVASDPFAAFDQLVQKEGAVLTTEVVEQYANNRRDAFPALESLQNAGSIDTAQLESYVRRQEEKKVSDDAYLKSLGTIAENYVNSLNTKKTDAELTAAAKQTAAVAQEQYKATLDRTANEYVRALTVRGADVETAAAAAAAAAEAQREFSARQRVVADAYVDSLTEKALTAKDEAEARAKAQEAQKQYLTGQRILADAYVNTLVANGADVQAAAEAKRAAEEAQEQYLQNLKKVADTYVDTLAAKGAQVQATAATKGIVETVTDSVQKVAGWLGLGKAPVATEEVELEFTSDRFLAAQNDALEAKNTAEATARALANAPAVSDFDQTAAAFAIASELTELSDDASKTAQINVLLSNYYADQGDLKTALAYMEIAQHEAEKVAYNERTVDLLLNEPQIANFMYSLDDTFNIQQKVTAAEQAILDALGHDTPTMAHAVMAGLRLDDFTSADKKAIGITFMGELLGPTREALIAGTATPEQIRQAGAVLISVINRAASTNTSLEYQANKCSRSGYCQYSYNNFNNNGAVAYRERTRLMYQQNSGPVDIVVENFLNGHYASEYGLDVVVPFPGADHYLNPKTVIAQAGKLPTWAEDRYIVGRTSDGHVFYDIPLSYKAPTPEINVNVARSYALVSESTGEITADNFIQIDEDTYAYVTPDGDQVSFPLLGEDVAEKMIAPYPNVLVTTSDCTSWGCRAGTAVAETVANTVETGTKIVTAILPIGSSDENIQQQREEQDAQRVAAQEVATQVRRESALLQNEYLSQQRSVAEAYVENLQEKAATVVEEETARQIAAEAQALYQARQKAAAESYVSDLIKRAQTAQAAIDEAYDPFAPGEPANTNTIIEKERIAEVEAQKAADQQYDLFAPGEPGNTYNIIERERIAAAEAKRVADQQYDPFAPGEPANATVLDQEKADAQEVARARANNAYDPFAPGQPGNTMDALLRTHEAEQARQEFYDSQRIIAETYVQTLTERGALAVASQEAQQAAEVAREEFLTIQEANAKAYVQELEKKALEVQIAADTKAAEQAEAVTAQTEETSGSPLKSFYNQVETIVKLAGSGSIDLVQKWFPTCLGFCENRADETFAPLPVTEEVPLPRPRPQPETEEVPLPRPRPQTVPEAQQIDPNMISTQEQLTASQVTEVFSTTGINTWESKPGATQLENLRAGTVAAAVELKDSCDCNLTLTGAAEAKGNDTDGGAYTHAEGYKFDVRIYDNPELVTYIKSLDRVGSANGATIYIDPSKPNITYTLKNSNLDVTVRPNPERTEVALPGL